MWATAVGGPELGAMRVEVEISDEAYAILKAFSQATGKKVEDMVRDSVLTDVHAIMLTTTFQEMDEAVKEKLK
jgi:hypothetical protein